MVIRFRLRDDMQLTPHNELMLSVTKPTLTVDCFRPVPLLQLKRLWYSYTGKARPSLGPNMREWLLDILTLENYLGGISFRKVSLYPTRELAKCKAQALQCMRRNL